MDPEYASPPPLKKRPADDNRYAFAAATIKDEPTHDLSYAYYGPGYSQSEYQRGRVDVNMREESKPPLIKKYKQEPKSSINPSTKVKQTSDDWIVDDLVLDILTPSTRRKRWAVGKKPVPKLHARRRPKAVEWPELQLRRQGPIPKKPKVELRYQSTIAPTAGEYRAAGPHRVRRVSAPRQPGEPRRYTPQDIQYVMAEAAERFRRYGYTKRDAMVEAWEEARRRSFQRQRS